MQKQNAIRFRVVSAERGNTNQQRVTIRHPLYGTVTGKASGQELFVALSRAGLIVGKKGAQHRHDQ